MMREAKTGGYGKKVSSQNALTMLIFPLLGVYIENIQLFKALRQVFGGFQSKLQLGTVAETSQTLIKDISSSSCAHCQLTLLAHLFTPSSMLTTMQPLLMNETNAAQGEYSFSVLFSFPCYQTDSEAPVEDPKALRGGCVMEGAAWNPQ